MKNLIYAIVIVLAACAGPAYAQNECITAENYVKEYVAPNMPNPVELVTKFEEDQAQKMVEFLNKNVFFGDYPADKVYFFYTAGVQTFLVIYEKEGCMVSWGEAPLSIIKAFKPDPEA